jgi:acetylglutamate kinase
MGNGPVVIKAGGALVADDERAAELALWIGASGRRCVVVHGGGKELTAVQAALGTEPAWHEGLRVTDEAALAATVMVLCGTVNQRLVAALNAAGHPAVGLSGLAGGMLEARVAAEGRLGHVGHPARVRTELVDAVLDASMVPVVAPLSAGPQGPLNVNADEAAAAIAIAHRASELLLLTDVPGVRVGDRTVRCASVADAAEWIADGTASDGMIPKLRAGCAAAAAGIHVRIGPLPMLGDPSAGTRISPLRREAA